MEPFILHDYQAPVVDQIVRDKRVLVKAPVGAGKTLVGVEAILRTQPKIALIVAPINTFRGWSKTFERQSRGEAVLRMIDARKAGKQAHEDLANSVPGYYFIGTERSRTQEWHGWDLDFVVVDEIHRASNRKSKTFKTLFTMDTEHIVGLSATPWGNKVEGAWAVGRLLFREEVMRSFWKWGTTHLKEEYDPYSYKKFSGEKVPGSIMASFPSVATMPSVYNGQPAIHEVQVELNPAQLKHYRELERDAITFLEENPLVAELPSTKYIRLMETTLATPSVEQVWDEETGDYRDVVYFKDDAKSSKADAVVDILTDLHAEHEEPVLIMTHSRKFATFLAKRLQSKGFNARQFVGGMGHEERTWKLENFGKEYSVLVAVVSTLAEGTDGLQDVCATEIWCSVSDNRILNEQGRGRLSRQGQKRTVNRYVVQAVGTIETEKQHPRLVVDQSILDSSYGEMATTTTTTTTTAGGYEL